MAFHCWQHNLLVIDPHNIYLEFNQEGKGRREREVDHLFGWFVKIVPVDWEMKISIGMANGQNSSHIAIDVVNSFNYRMATVTLLKNRTGHCMLLSLSLAYFFFVKSWSSCNKWRWGDGRKCIRSRRWRLTRKLRMRICVWKTCELDCERAESHKAVNLNRMFKTLHIFPMKWSNKSRCIRNAYETRSTKQNCYLCLVLSIDYVRIDFNCTDWIVFDFIQIVLTHTQTHQYRLCIEPHNWQSNER